HLDRSTAGLAAPPPGPKASAAVGASDHSVPSASETPATAVSAPARSGLSNSEPFPIPGELAAGTSLTGIRSAAAAPRDPAVSPVTESQASDPAPATDTTPPRGASHASEATPTQSTPPAAGPFRPTLSRQTRIGFDHTDLNGWRIFEAGG